MNDRFFVDLSSRLQVKHQWHLPSRFTTAEWIFEHRCAIYFRLDNHHVV